MDTRYLIKEITRLLSKANLRTLEIVLRFLMLEIYDATESCN